MTTNFSHIIAAKVDGRTQNVRYRQNQLYSLHQSILTYLTNLRTAIQADSGNTVTETDVELFASVSDLRKHYEALEFEQELSDEYRVARGKDYKERRVGAGLAYIAQGEYSPFFSVIAPLSAALGAGNCVIVELAKTHPATNEVLRKLLLGALDSEAFAITDSRPTDQAFMNECVQVIQTYIDEPSTAQRRISPSSSRTVAVVDRTANIEQAAQAIVSACFSFGGNSPYAPDLVLVNEFSEEKFVRAVVQCSSKYLAEKSRHAADETLHSQKSKAPSTKELFQQGKEIGDVHVVISGTNATVLRIKNRESALMKQKMTGAFLAIHSVSSLDDAIDVANTGNSHLSASYIFSAPTTAKYLSQFISSNISCINHIPSELLVGPVAPLDFPVSLDTRYTRAMFEIPLGITLHESPDSKAIGNVLNDVDYGKSARAMRDSTSTPLSPTGQKEGGAVGFFEQGLVTGGLFAITPILTSFAVVGFFGVRIALRRWRL